MLLVVDNYCFSFFILLMPEPESVNLRAVTGGNEGFNLIIADKRHDGRELVLREQGLNLDMFLSAVSALYMIEGTSAHEGIYDVRAYPIRFIRNDTDALAFVQGCSEIVNGETVDPGADDTDDHHAEVIDEEGGAADDDTTDSDR